jgi:hypothetical protein
LKPAVPIAELIWGGGAAFCRLDFGFGFGFGADFFWGGGFGSD